MAFSPKLLCLLALVAVGSALTINQDTPIQSLPTDPNALAEVLMSTEGASDEVSKIVNIIKRNVQKAINQTLDELASSRCEQQRQGFKDQISAKQQVIRGIESKMAKIKNYINDRAARIDEQKVRQTKSQTVITNLETNNKNSLTQLENLNNTLAASKKKQNDMLEGLKIIRDAVVEIQNEEAKNAQAVAAPLPTIKASLMELAAFSSKLGGSAHELIQAAIHMASENADGYKRLGCFADQAARAISPLEGTDNLLRDAYKSRTDAINKCYRVAKARGMKVFAVQDGGWCAAADSLLGYDKYGPSTLCKDGKGGPLANDVYTIVATDSDASLGALIALLDQVRAATLAEIREDERSYKIQYEGVSRALALRREELKVENTNLNNIKQTIGELEFDLANRKTENDREQQTLDAEKKEIDLLQRRLANVETTCTTLQKTAENKLDILRKRLVALDKVVELVKNRLAGKVSANVEGHINAAASGAEAPVHYKYTAWGTCSVSCGDGFQTRQASCHLMLGDAVPGNRCTRQLGAPILTQRCNLKKCSRDCKLSASITWKACPAQCKTSPSAKIYQDGLLDIAQQPDGPDAIPCAPREKIRECPNLQLCKVPSTFASFSSAAGTPQSIAAPVSLGHMPFTFSAWVKPSRLGYGVIFSKEDCADKNERLRLQLHADGHVALITNNLETRLAGSTSPESKDNNGVLPEFVSYKQLKADRASHILLVRSFQGKAEINSEDQYTYRLYIDGVLQKTARILAKSSWNTERITIGARKCAATNGDKFPGLIADARFWDNTVYGEADAKILAESKPLGI